MMRALGRVRPMEVDAFEVLFRREFVRLVQALTLVAGEREAAADAVQDAFVQAHRHRERVLGLEDPAGWLRHVALNRIRNQHRGQARQRDALPRLLGDERELDVPFGGAAVDAAGLLAALPPQQRAAAALYYLLDQPTSAVADHLGVTEATVRSHLRAARQRLHHDLAEEEA